MRTDEALLAAGLIDSITELVMRPMAKKDIPFENDLWVILMERWLDVTRQGMKKVREFLTGLTGTLGEADVQRMLNLLQAEASTLSDAAAGQAANLFRESYEAGKVGGQLAGGIVGLQWGMVDDEAVEWLTDHHVYWIKEYYNKHISGAIAEHTAEALRQGLGRDAAGKMLADFFDAYPGVASQPAAYWRGLAANAMNRSRNFGLVGGFEEAGIEALRVVAVMDERTSDICRRLNNTIIPIGKAVGQRRKLIMMSDPEGVKEVTPWLPISEIEDLTDTEIQGRGMIMPPYHFHCRTTVVAAELAA